MDSFGMHSFWNLCLLKICGLNLSGSVRKPNFSTNSENILKGGFSYMNSISYPKVYKNQGSKHSILI